MSMLKYIEFVIVSLLYIMNIHKSIFMLSESPINKSRLNIPSVCIFFTLSVIYSVFGSYCNIYLRSLIFLMYYTSLFVCSALSNPHISQKISLYISALYIILDSIAQSLLYCILEPMPNHLEKETGLKSISLIINGIIFFILSKKEKQKDNAILIKLNSIPDYIYAIILTALFMSGSVLTNFLIDSNTINPELRTSALKFLSAATISLLIAIILILMLYCVTGNHYKYISSILEKQIKKQLEYYEKIDEKNKELRKFKHDYNNHMTALQSLIADESYTDALTYIKELTLHLKPETNMFDTGNKIADAILSDKSVTAISQGVSISFSGEIYEKINPVDICVILSNALDNAIEASLNCQANSTVKVKALFAKDIQIIHIENPVADDLRIENNFIETTKNDIENHGFGLYNIKGIVEKYKGSFQISCENHIFSLEVGFQVSGD